jgi:L-2-hydroxyglutarate oxidase LhgO
VLTVGGGIAALALAPMLSRTGVAVEVIERAPSPSSSATERAANTIAWSGADGSTAPCAG